MNISPVTLRPTLVGQISRGTLLAGLFLSLGACRDMNAAATRTALHAGLTPALVQGLRYQHEIFFRAATPGAPLYVFIEGDGSPWRSNGTRVSDDPTPRNPLALSLAARTPRSVLYLGRPCYFSARGDAACDPRAWTSQRFSADVVESMAAVINRYASLHRSSNIILIGYSGGGVLAVLIAPRVPLTQGVVTIAADLDTDAWVRWHRYLPLAGSLNPATQPPLDSRLIEWHLVGDRDSIAPPGLDERYLDRISADRVWHFPTFDHVCCWVDEWAAIVARIDTAIREISPH